MSVFKHDGPTKVANRIKTKLEKKKLYFSRTMYIDLIEESLDDDHGNSHKVDSILSQHQKSKHEGIKYHCKECGKQLSTKASLNIHIRVVHEGIRYSCGECRHQATSKGNLAHEGIKHPCDKCQHQASSKRYLAQHKELFMKGLNIPVDDVNF